MDAGKTPIEPFQQVADFVERYARDEGLRGVEYIPLSHMPALRRVAREFGVILHDDGSMELIRQ